MQICLWRQYYVISLLRCSVPAVQDVQVSYETIEVRKVLFYQ